MTHDAVRAFLASPLASDLHDVPSALTARHGGHAVPEVFQQAHTGAICPSCNRGTLAVGVVAMVGAMVRGHQAAKRGKKARDSARATVTATMTTIGAWSKGFIPSGQAVKSPTSPVEKPKETAVGSVSFVDKPKETVVGSVSSVAETKETVVCSVPLSFETRRHKQETGQDRVFHWLGRGPAPGSALFESLHKHFPNALPGSAMHLRSTRVLQDEFGFFPSNTLLGTSFCPDEINNQNVDLTTLARKHWGRVFPMGGIGGAPYVGETGFVAFSSHVAKDGNIVVIFGPHVGISEKGEVGAYLRDGQSKHSSACGAVIGAYKACMCGGVDVGKGNEFSEYDMQMDEIKAEFAPHAAAISQAENVMASCAYQAWEMVKDRMLKIVNTKFGSGKLVLIGGIQINMPYPTNEDYFLPMMFEMRQEGQSSKDLMHYLADFSTQQDLKRAPWAAYTAQAETFAWLSWSPSRESPVYRALQTYFPGALPGQAVHQRTLRIFGRYGFEDKNTIFGTSLCPDEINNESFGLPVLMQEFWGEVFPMGGISGAPFAGKTGFKAFSSHVAEDGNIIVLFGPHVAISATGEVGYCHRSGQDKQSTACGAVIGAYKACRQGWSPSAATAGAYDRQMDWIKQQIAPHARAIATSENPYAALAYQSYEMVKDKIFSVVNNDFGSGYLCLVGGIQINLPDGMDDHFLPCTFELRRAGDC
eukprot:CAMPEP_0117485922 /NCGR_PEP_ID=MMETSP0784-20121206/15212_1 /TAXON_ID=39447 /ORGANISM="" /LENGTH=701 /DNA_ID=CAMNT_0005280519 /DNA_START=74 /DNA_END=2176 /DNA_ORIENTATION=-